MSHTLNIKNLVCGYHRQAIIEAKDAEMRDGELILLTGRNGSGKTTLLKTIAGLIPPIHGTAYCNETNLLKLSSIEKAKLISLILTQRITIGGMDVLTLVTLGRYPHAGRLGWMGKEDTTIAEQCLERIGMSEFKHRVISELSDGELQKVMIARALAQKAPVMLLDEPTAFLDYIAREDVFKLLLDLAEHDKISILLSSHEIDLGKKYAHRIWNVKEGQLSA